MTNKPSKLLKRIQYTNSFGYPKELCVYEPNDEGKYPVTLWELRHGELCGGAEMTRQELNDYLEHFGVVDRF